MKAARARLANAALALIVMSACGEVNAPPASGHDEQNTPSSTMIAEMPDGTLKHAVGGPILQSDVHSFAVVQGKGGKFEIKYRDLDSDAESGWFLRLKIPASARLVDESGRALEKGDTLHVTVAVQPASFVAHFEPHGAQFTGKHPATLSFNYKYADLGDRNAKDLGIWYQATADAEWTKENAEVDVHGTQVVMALLHFSNYAVAF